MKILILANFDVGLYQFRRELIEDLLKEHQVLLALPDGPLVRPLEQMGCRFVHIALERRGINPVTDLKLCCAYFDLIRREKPDLVITYTIKPNIYGGMVCRIMKVPYACNITGLGTAFQNQGLLRKLVTTLYRCALKRAQVVFYENSDNMLTLLNENITKIEQCVCLNGAGVNLEHYRPVPYPSHEETVRFLFMGRIMAEKGINELLSAMEQLRKEGYRCILDVLGQFEECYEETLRNAESEGWLCCHGYQEDVRPFISSSHCFVLPSWHEGMANTNLECAAMGRPVITSDIPGCRESVIPEVSGLLCQPRNPESLYRAMRRFLEMSNDARAAMGTAGRAHMEQNFDKKQIISKTRDALKL